MSRNGTRPFDAVRHRHSVCSLQIGVVQIGGDRPQFTLELSGIRHAAQVLVAAKDFIGAFAGKHHLDMLATPGVPENNWGWRCAPAPHRTTQGGK